MVQIDETDEPLEAIVVDRPPANPLTTAIAWVVLAAVVLTVGWWVWTRWINPSAGSLISQYVHKDVGETFASPPAGFTVAMPTKPVITTDANEYGQIVTASSNPGSGYEFTVTNTAQPDSQLANYTSALNQFAGQVASGKSIESQTKPTPIIDVAVKDVVYTDGSSTWRTRLILRADRLYAITAKTPNSDTGPYERLITSFKMLG
ncbi:MAG: hypothetical protein JJE46_08455 [Acidimicrobiia bacterium]|nr:hypothetical protein [Acidimicrobiia bacterium]